MALSIVEGLLRATWCNTAGLVKADPVLGVRHISNASSWYAKSCFATHAHTNSYGLRDDEYSPTKPSGVHRIVVLGDSYTEALEMPLEKTFHSIIESDLQQLGKKVEVLSFGLMGYGTAQEMLTLKHDALKFMPDVVILMFCTDNDIRNNSRLLSNRLAWLEPVPRPFFDLRGGELVLTPPEVHWSKKSWVGAVKSFLKAHYRTYAFLRTHVAASPTLGPLFFTRGTFHDEDGGVQRADVTLDFWVYQKQYDEVWKHAWNVTERLIIETRALAEASGAHFLLVAIPNARWVHPELWKSTMEKYEKLPRSGWDLTKPHKLLKTLAEREQIRYLDLSPVFKKFVRATGRKTILACDGHWNETGHRVAAQSLEEYLVSENLVP